ncbi:UNVERIFIED_CONTAM: hypothetical protein HHA_295400 [Hammondia hammondi]|eukprot:XP_008888140.1 hypothetical protein HHA_295400 [Hammondia hammondi]
MSTRRQHGCACTGLPEASWAPRGRRPDAIEASLLVPLGKPEETGERTVRKKSPVKLDFCRRKKPSTELSLPAQELEKGDCPRGAGERLFPVSPLVVNPCAVCAENSQEKRVAEDGGQLQAKLCLLDLEKKQTEETSCPQNEFQARLFASDTSGSFSPFSDAALFRSPSALASPSPAAACLASLGTPSFPPSSRPLRFSLQSPSASPATSSLSRLRRAPSAPPHGGDPVSSAGSVPLAFRLSPPSTCSSCSPAASGDACSPQGSFRFTSVPTHASAGSPDLREKKDAPISSSPDGEFLNPSHQSPLPPAAPLPAPEEAAMHASEEDPPHAPEKPSTHAPGEGLLHAQQQALGSSDVSVSSPSWTRERDGQAEGTVPSAEREARKPDSGGDADDEYFLKKVKFLDLDTCVVLQNRNGPCPLLALANVLLLTGRLSLQEALPLLDPAAARSRAPSEREPACTVRGSRLIEQLAAVLLQVHGRRLRSGDPAAAVYQYHLQEVLDLLPQLRAGLDVNCSFRSPSAFEYTAGISLFDLFGVRLLHGWVPDLPPSHKLAPRVFEERSALPSPPTSPSRATLPPDLLTVDAQTAPSSSSSSSSASSCLGGEGGLQGGERLRCACEACFLSDFSYNTLVERCVAFNDLMDELRRRQEREILLQQAAAEGGAAGAATKTEDASATTVMVEMTQRGDTSFAGGESVECKDFKGCVLAKKGSEAAAGAPAKPAQATVDLIDRLEPSEVERFLREGELLSSFLSSTSSQLTERGLRLLSSPCSCFDDAQPLAAGAVAEVPKVSKERNVCSSKCQCVCHTSSSPSSSLPNGHSSSPIPNGLSSSPPPSLLSSPPLSTQAKREAREASGSCCCASCCRREAVLGELAPAVLFRNNHFLTVVRRGSSLYGLATDSSFLHAGGDAVWERLVDVWGDNVYCDEQFRDESERRRESERERARERERGRARVGDREREQERHTGGLLGGTSGHRERRDEREKRECASCDPYSCYSSQREEEDFRLALRLQEEEERQVRAASASRERHWPASASVASGASQQGLSGSRVVGRESSVHLHVRRGGDRDDRASTEVPGEAESAADGSRGLSSLWRNRRTKKKKRRACSIM